MSNQETRQKVYELLWKLFHKECPYYAKREKQYYLIADFVNSDKKMEVPKDMDEWTILNEILPDVIIFDGDEYIFTHHKNIINGKNRKHWINYEIPYEEDVSPYSTNLYRTGWFNDIWQAFLNLLLALKSHPERDKMEFKWEKTSRQQERLDTIFCKI